MHQEALNPRGSRPEKPICVIVLGMHRSGTSAITKALNFLGAALPKEILLAGLGNDLGHWEPAKLVNLHDEMLQEFGSSWDDWRPLILSQANAVRLKFYKERIKELILEQFAGENLFVLKDPRICRFLELYKQALDELSYETKIVFVHRNPLAVSASLFKRNQIVEEYGCLLWLRHILDAELSSQGLHRVFVSYETVMDDWRVGLNSLKNVLGIDFRDLGPHIQQSVSSHFSRDFQHHNPSIEDVVRNENLIVWIKDAFEALSTNDEGLISRSLKPIRDVFDEVSPYFARASEKDRNALQHQFQASRDALQHQFQADGDALQKQLHTDRDLILQRVKMGDNQLLEMEHKLSAVNEQNQDLLEKYLDTMRCLESETALKIRREQELSAIRKSTSWRISYPIRALGEKWEALKETISTKSR
jgi:hypothetical protein